MTAPEDQLILDIRRDLERVDAVMTKVIMNPATSDEFIRDPSGTLTRLGLHPRTTREIHDRTNRIFYATLTNTELMEFLNHHYSTFDSPEIERNHEVFGAALARGEISNSIELDIEAANHLLNQPEALRRMFRLILHDLNNRGLLANTHEPRELDDYIDRIVDAISERRAVRDLPVLEEWDDRYGVGKDQGVGLVIEVAAIATALAPVEAAVFATVFVPVVAYSNGAVTKAARNAVVGDAGAARTLETVGALLRFAGEVMVHANNFERSRPQA